MQTERDSLTGTGTQKKRRHQKKKKRKTANVSTVDQVQDDVDVKEMQAEKRGRDTDEDSSEEQVLKKKKKKKPVPTEAGKKGAKSIRQMKREKHAARLAEAEGVAKDALKQQCLQYLSQWKHNRPSWKFMKAKQLWLYKHKFSSKLIPDESWPTCLEYFSSAQGNIKNILLDDAKKVIEKMDACLEKEENENEVESTPDAEKPDQVSYVRARDIIQHLEE